MPAMRRASFGIASLRMGKRSSCTPAKPMTAEMVSRTDRRRKPSGVDTPQSASTCATIFALSNDGRDGSCFRRSHGKGPKLASQDLGSRPPTSTGMIQPS
eukprot:2542402-Rhodomonas_salina.1